MLTGIHYLLTYKCSFECDHCFLYCSPSATGTFTLAQLRKTLDEARTLGTVEWIYFEGGEPFLFYPLMVEGVKVAHGMGFRSGVVTNCYWATSVEDADLWLGPLRELEIADLSLSDDEFHHEQKDDNPAKLAFASATGLNMPVRSICIEEPKVEVTTGGSYDKGAPVVGGDVIFRGRAVEKLAKDLPRRPWQEFTECKREELRDPERVHLDSYGNVQVCQGLSIGNMWNTPFSELVKQYDPDSHPICGPLLRGGPAQLAREYKVQGDAEYIDECHFCYMLRRALLSRFPEYLGPRQVYGLE